MIAKNICFETWIKQPRPSFEYPDAYHYYPDEDSCNYTIWWESHEDDTYYAYNLRGKRRFTLMEIVDMNETHKIAKGKLLDMYKKGIK